MDPDAERVMVYELMECLAKCFKWDLDCKPVVEREPRAGSSAGSVESLSSPGWVLCPKAVDATVTR
jgi:hypothetical protein